MAVAGGFSVTNIDVDKSVPIDAIHSIYTHIPVGRGWEIHGGAGLLPGSGIGYVVCVDGA